jgi:hypothetical protein
LQSLYFKNWNFFVLGNISANKEFKVGYGGSHL